MIQLREQFVSGAGGFTGKDRLTYTQLKRNEKAAVYERSRDGKPYDYEAFLIKIKKAGVYKLPKGKTQTLVEDTEQYPSSSQFGFVAWSYGNVGMAMHRFHELTHGKVNEIIDETGAAKDVDDDVEDGVAPEVKSDSVVEPPVNASPIIKVDDAKPYKGPDLVIPVGEFSTRQLAAHNNVDYTAAFLFRKELERTGKIKFSRKQKAEGRGKPTDIFVTV